jgi:hypothetical protein
VKDKTYWEEDSMKYLGIVKRKNGNLMLPDSFQEIPKQGDYEAVLIGGDLLLLPPPLDRARLKKIEELADRSIEEHRQTLEKLSK